MSLPLYPPFILGISSSYPPKLVYWWGGHLSLLTAQGKSGGSGREIKRVAKCGEE